MNHAINQTIRTIQNCPACAPFFDMQYNLDNLKSEFIKIEAKTLLLDKRANEALNGIDESSMYLPKKLIEK